MAGNLTKCAKYIPFQRYNSSGISLNWRLLWASVAESPDPWLTRSRIRIKEFEFYSPKILFLSSRKNELGYSSLILDPDPNFFPIPDTGVRKALDPGSGFVTLLWAGSRHQVWTKIKGLETANYWKYWHVVQVLAQRKLQRQFLFYLCNFLLIRCFGLIARINLPYLPNVSCIQEILAFKTDEPMTNGHEVCVELKFRRPLSWKYSSWLAPGSDLKISASFMKFRT